MKHGEYKVPGGKLVIVECEVVEGRLRDVEVSGDFFLEPPETLAAIRSALEGASAEADADVLVERLRGAVPPDAVLVGLTLDGVAVAARRALS